MATLLSKTAATTPNDTSKQVDESTDTVYGQLDKYTNSNSILLKRAAQTGLESAASRGLTNSSIAIGASQGAYYDKAGQFAIKDAEIYNSRKDQNQQAQTALEQTRMNNEGSILQSRENNATQLESNRIQADSNERISTADRDANRQNLLSEIASKERINQTQIDSQQAEIDARMQISENELAAQTELTLKELESNERVATANREADALRAQLERENSIRLQQMSAESAMAQEQLAQASQDARQRYESLSSAWNNLQQGIAAIDPNAKSASQITQLNRLQESFQARMEFVNSMGGYTSTSGNDQAPTSNNNNNSSGGSLSDALRGSVSNMDLNAGETQQRQEAEVKMADLRTELRNLPGGAAGNAGRARINAQIAELSKYLNG